MVTIAMKTMMAAAISQYVAARPRGLVHDDDMGLRSLVVAPDRMALVWCGRELLNILRQVCAIAQYANPGYIRIEYTRECGAQVNRKVATPDRREAWHRRLEAAGLTLWQASVDLGKNAGTVSKWRRQGVPSYAWGYLATMEMITDEAGRAEWRHRAADRETT